MAADGEDEGFRFESDLSLLDLDESEQDYSIKGHDLFEFFVQRGFLQNTKIGIPSKLKEQSTKLKEQLKKQKNALDKKLSEAPFIRQIDKISFIAGVIFLLVTEYVMLCNPSFMAQYFVACTVPLMMFRFVTYHKSKFHYFMIDFCYWTLFMLMFQIIFYPQSELLFQIVFAMSNGPLLWGIYMWGNKLVFHDIDKMTSVYIHFLPALTTYCMRWNQFADKSAPTLSVFLSKGLYFYFFWQMCYVLKTEWVDRNKLRKDQRIMTSARWMTKKAPHPIYVWVCANKERVPMGEVLANRPFLMLILIQVIYTSLTLLPMPWIYDSPVAHGVLMSALFLVALKHGAAYYFDVFSESYVRRMQRMISEQRKESSQEKSEEPSSTSDPAKE